MSTDFITQIPHEWYALFLFISVFIENIFPPYPGDTVVVFAGYVAGTGHLKLPWLIIAIISGNLMSATVMYYFGFEIMEFVLKRVKSKTIRDIFSRESLQQTEGWFKRYGFWAVVFSRFSAGFRFFVAIVAGMVRMNITVFLFAFLLATIIWNSLLVYGGYTLGKNWQQVMEYLKVYSWAVGIIIVLVAGFIFYRFKKKEKSR